MSAIAAISSGEAVVAVALSLVGLAIEKLVEWIVAALRGQRSPLGRYYWLVSYAPDDANWSKPVSVELVRFCRRGRRVRGRMYRIYPDHHQRSWAFEGRLHDGKQLTVMYTSTGEDFGSNGIMILGLLTRWIWCGVFQEAPNPERGAELSWTAERVGAIRRIGPSVTEEAHAELLAADCEGIDRVRGFLALIPPTDPCSPVRVARGLPGSARRVLLDPLASSWRIRLLRLVARSRCPLPRSLRLYLRMHDRVEPRPWSSPSRDIFFGDPDEDEAA